MPSLTRPRIVPPGAPVAEPLHVLSTVAEPVSPDLAAQLEALNQSHHALQADLLFERDRATSIEQLLREGN